MTARRPAMPTLCDTVVVAMTGSIGTLWAALFVLELRAGGHVREVRVVMSPSASQFVTPVAMRAISGAPVLTTLFDADAPFPIGHVQISDTADIMIVMPATANIIGKVAGGLADDAVSASIMASACPVVFVPSMNERMWQRAAVQRNVRALVRDGHHVVPPVAGTVVSTGRTAIGGMPDSDTLIKALRKIVRPPRR
ncbi:MAG TPA: flavoprotein [Vicinamibacterales bacterium]|nr:flavoprotein [Vicinamibacterales bacterium]